MSEDIKLETEGESDLSGDVTDTYHPTGYQPRSALKLAIRAWLDEFYVKRDCSAAFAPSPVGGPGGTPPGGDVTSVNTCMAITPTTQIPPVGIVPPLEDNVSPVLNGLANDMLQDSLMQPAMSPVNSLTHKFNQNRAASELAAADARAGDERAAEPMDCVPIIPPPSAGGASSAKQDLAAKLDNEMQVDAESPVCDKEADARLSCDDLELIVDLFYLPYEHGSRAVCFLNEFHWLKTNCHLVNKSALSEDPVLRVSEGRVGKIFLILSTRAQ